MIIPSQKLNDQQRMEFYKSKDTYKLMELAFSKPEDYFIINKNKFTKDKAHNKKLFSDAVDTVVIDPENVSHDSIQTDKAIGISG